jgi:predicted nucleotidyltransferase
VRPEEFRTDSDVDVMVEFAENAPWRNYLRRSAILESAVLLDVA